MAKGNNAERELTSCACFVSQLANEGRSLKVFLNKVPLFSVSQGILKAQDMRQKSGSHVPYSSATLEPAAEETSPPGRPGTSVDFPYTPDNIDVSTHQRCGICKRLSP